MSESLAIDATGLEMSFGDTHALRGLDLQVPTGRVLGVLGPNGAGKTTAVRILATLLRPDKGSARVAGHDVVKDAGIVRSKIGLIGQNAAVDEMLTGRENLVMFGRLHGLNRADARSRAAELLERFQLSDAGDRVAKGYSGGMRRRLDIAAGMVVRPAVLFLDEPTTGLDPVSRNDVWEFVGQVVEDGTTVLLTTQYLDEADQLADDIVVIDHGTVIAQGTSTELKSRIGGERVEVVAADPARIEQLAGIIGSVSGTETTTVADQRRVAASFADGARRLPELVRAIDDAGIELAGLELRQPTLDDVFLHLTGRAADDTSDDTATTGGDR